jgi:hypothetical protein
MSDWVTVREAAEILGVHMSAIPKMIRRGDLTPREQRPRLRLSDVERLRDARAARKQVSARQRWMPAPPDDEHEWLLAPAAAAVLGCSVGAVRARAVRGRVPSMLSDGRRWFRLDHLELVVRAQAARATRRVARR